MRRSGLFNPKPPVPSFRRASAKPASDAPGQLKHTHKSKAVKVETKPSSSQVLEPQLRSIKSYGVVQGVSKAGPPTQKIKPSVTSVPHKTTSLPEPEFVRDPPTKPDDVLPEDDYADEEFESYDGDDFESWDDSPKVKVKVKSAEEASEEIAPTTEGEGIQIGKDGGENKSNCLGEEEKEKQRKMAILRQVSFKIFCQAPISLPDLFEMGCGPAARLAVAVTQTNDDAYSRDTQTDNVPQVDAGSQFPTDVPCSSPMGMLEFPVAKANKECHLEKPAQSVSLAFEKASDIHLNHLISNAAHVVGALKHASSNPVDVSLAAVVSKGSEQALLNGHVHLFWEQTLRGRSVLDLCFQTGTYLLLSSYSRSLEHQTQNAKQGCVCIWDVLKPAHPKHLLLLEGIPSCVAWAMPLRSKRQQIVVCGTDAGSLCLWEVSSEAQSLHGCGDEEWCPCHPTYSTSHQMSDNHKAPVCSVSARSANGLKLQVDSGKHGESSQILTLDSSGTILVWVTKEVGSGDEDKDYGLRPGGRVCLIKTSEISIYSHLAELPGLQLQGATHMSVFPNCTHHLLISTDDGPCIRVALFGTAEAPRKFYRDPQLGLPAPALCSCFSPFLEDCFLVAYGDGVISLFSSHQSLPLHSWTTSAMDDKVVGLHWSSTVPSIFYVFHASKVLYQWDVLQEVPVASQRVNEAATEEASVCGISVRCQSKMIPAPNCADLAFAAGYVNGRVEVHLMRPDESSKDVENGKRDIREHFPRLEGEHTL